MSDEPRFDSVSLKRQVDQFLAPKVPRGHNYVEVEYRTNGVLKVEVVAKVKEHWDISADLKWAIADRSVDAGVKVRRTW